MTDVEMKRGKMEKGGKTVKDGNMRTFECDNETKECDKDDTKKENDEMKDETKCHNQGMEDEQERVDTTECDKDETKMNEALGKKNPGDNEMVVERNDEERVDGNIDVKERNEDETTMNEEMALGKTDNK